VSFDLIVEWGFPTAEAYPPNREFIFENPFHIP